MPELPRDSRWRKLPTLERVSRVWGDAGSLVRVLSQSDNQKTIRLRNPAKTSPDRLRTLLIDSRLITPAALDAVVQSFEDSPAQDEAAADPALALAERLVEKRLLSPWQAEKILAGKYKGFVLANYRISDLLGTGKLSSVYRAEHQMMRRPVAIKILMDKVARHSTARDLFFQRARHVAALDHKNLVHVFDMGEQRGICYVVMEYVSGYDLHRLVRRVGPLPLDLSASLVAQVCQGMLAVHAGNETLEGLHASDVVLDPNGVPHLLTLALARVLAHHPTFRAAADDKIEGQRSAVDGAELDRQGIGRLLLFLLAGPPDPGMATSSGDLTAATVAEEDATIQCIAQRPDAAGPLVDVAQGLLGTSGERLTIAAAARQLTQWLAETQA